MSITERQQETESQLMVMPKAVERSSVLLMPVMDVQTAMARLQEFQVFCASYLQESKDGGSDGGDYGIIPGTKKSTLFKSGADKLCEVYGLYDEYEVISSVENWETGLFDYTLKCLLKSRRDDSIVGTGVGSCSSWESKYRWRESAKKCPKCGKEAIIKGKEQYGGGWLCWGKKDGCGAKFADKDASIEGQQTGRVENPDIVDSKNTVLKMAKKRAKIDATIGVTRSSGIFTQDMDDFAVKPEAPAAPTKQSIDKRIADAEAEWQAEGKISKADMEARTKAYAAQTGDVAPRLGGAGSKIIEVSKPLEFSGNDEWIPPAEEPKPDFQPLPPLAELVEKAKTSAEGFIDGGMQTNFAIRFKESLLKEYQKQAEELRHNWLGRHGFTDNDGNPTSKAIPSSNFEAIKADACAWAKKYRGLTI